MLFFPSTCRFTSGNSHPVKSTDEAAAARHAFPSCDSKMVLLGSPGLSVLWIYGWSYWAAPAFSVAASGRRATKLGRRAMAARLVSLLISVVPSLGLAARSVCADNLDCSA